MAVFTKLASQLTADKLGDLAIIPLIFLAQVLISWACAWLMGKLFRFKDKRPKNFLTAMAVCICPLPAPRLYRLRRIV